MFFGLMSGVPFAFAEDNISLSDFAGTWHSTGISFGQPAISTMNWTPTLDGKFYRLDYEIKVGAPDNHKTTFRGVGYYKQASGDTLEAFWADNSGDLHAIKATLEPTLLVSIWGVAGEKLGRTHYELIDPNVVQITDWILTKKGWHQFNQNTFTKQAGD